MIGVVMNPLWDDELMQERRSQDIGLIIEIIILLQPYLQVLFFCYQLFLGERLIIEQIDYFCVFW